jgi:hypothetical protein
LVDEEGIVAADIDTKSVVMARQLRDPSGHYSRPDILGLTVKSANVVGLATSEPLICTKDNREQTRGILLKTVEPLLEQARENLSAAQ